MNDTSHLKPLESKSAFWSASRLISGAILGAASYILIANAVVDQTDMGCYQTGWIRSIIEASTFPAWILIGSTVHPESIFYRPVIYGLSSIPYAVLGALIVWRSKEHVIFKVGLFIVACLGLSLFAWAFFMAAICA